METIYIIDRRSYVDRRDIVNQSDPLYYEDRVHTDRRTNQDENVIVVASEDELLEIVSELGDSDQMEFYASFDEQNQIYKVVAKHSDGSGNTTLH